MKTNSRRAQFQGSIFQGSGVYSSSSFQKLPGIHNFDLFFTFKSNKSSDDLFFLTRNRKNVTKQGNGMSLKLDLFLQLKISQEVSFNGVRKW